MRCQIRTRGRIGFTLVELLVVIAIIAVLVALLASGVFKILDYIPLAQTTNDIQQMAVGIEAFKVKYKVYPPSYIVLPATNSAPTDLNSQNYLLAIWPRINFAACNFSNSQNPIPLFGDQCLVYFLQGPSGTGWSTNPTNPTFVGGSRVPPFFDFPTGRLINYRGNPSFLSFADSYALPTRASVYLYFSSGRNGYNLTSPGDCPNPSSSNNPLAMPYIQPTTLPYNPNSFQIISAGKDLNYGPGGAWVPNTPGKQGTYAYGSPGFDDLSNFYSGLLGE